MNDIAWTWILIRASGITAWVLLTVVVAYGLFLRTRVLRNAQAPLAMLTLHRWVGAMALGFLAVHLGLLLVDPYVQFTIPELFIPFLNDWNPLYVAFGIAAVWCLIPVSVIGRIRSRMGKAGNTWFKRTHLLSYAAWPLASMHYVLAGTDATEWWALSMLAAASIGLLFLLITRGFLPRWTSPRRPAPERKPAARVTSTVA